MMSEQIQRKESHGPLNRILVKDSIKKLHKEEVKPTAKRIWLKAKKTKSRLKYPTVKTLLKKMATGVGDTTREKKKIDGKDREVYIYYIE